MAKTTSDLRESRRQAAEYFASAGLRVLPATPYSASPEKFLQAFGKDLQAADVFVQILGESYSDRSDAFPEGEEIKQFAMAQAAKKVILQWRSKSVRLQEIDEAMHRDFVGGAGVICNDLVEFLKLAVERAGGVREARAADAGDGLFVLVKADENDMSLADEVVKHLQPIKVRCRITANGQPIATRLKSVPYAAVLIVYDQCPRNWGEAVGDQLLAVDLDLAKQGAQVRTIAPVRAYYYVPNPKRPLPYVGRDVLAIERNNPEALERLRRAIFERRTSP